MFVRRSSLAGSIGMRESSLSRCNVLSCVKSPLTKVASYHKDWCRLGNGGTTVAGMKKPPKALYSPVKMTDAYSVTFG